jgi:hypothetical protein
MRRARAGPAVVVVVVSTVSYRQDGDGFQALKGQIPRVL